MLNIEDNLTESILRGKDNISFSFFEIPTENIFNNSEDDIFDTAGGIWDTDDSLDWEMELDAEIFGDQEINSGLPVNIPDKKERNNFNIENLAKAVKEEAIKIAKKTKPKTKPKVSPVWSFEDFKPISVDPPSRHPVKIENKEVDLFDLLGSSQNKKEIKKEERNIEESIAPSFPDIDAFNLAKPKSSQRRKRKIKSAPVKTKNKTFDLFDDIKDEGDPENFNTTESKLLKKINKPKENIVSKTVVTEDLLSVISDNNDNGKDSDKNTPANSISTDLNESDYETASKQKDVNNPVITNKKDQQKNILSEDDKKDNDRMMTHFLNSEWDDV